MTSRATAAMLAVSMMAGSGAPPRDAECRDGGKIVTELGQRAQAPETFASVGGGVVPYPSTAQPNARYVRVRFTVESPPDCEWFLTVRDPTHRLIQVFGREDFKTSGTRWTHRVTGSQALFDMTPCGGNRAPTVKFEEYIWMPDTAANPYYSLQTVIEAYKPITEVQDTALRRLGDVAGFLVSSWDRSSWVCSGVMVTPTLMLTNWHCGGPSTLPDKGMWNADIQRDTLIDMSFDGDTLSRELQITRLATTPNKALDFVVLRTAAVDALGPVRPVTLATADPAANDDIRVVHHPGGKIKQLSWNCVVRDANYKGWQDSSVKSEFTHVCDTEGGSSGAPVLNTRGELVGLHHLGFDFDQVKCVQTDRVNKAVKISAILDAIKRDNKEVYDEIVRWQTR